MSIAAVALSRPRQRPSAVAVRVIGMILRDLANVVVTMLEINE